MTATVSPAGATGRVTFYDGAVLLGVGTLSSSGTASFSTALLPAGIRRLKAYYGGDPARNASTSNTISQTVGAVAANILAAGPDPLPVPPLTNQQTVDLALTGDFNGDGKADLAMISSFSGLTILLGIGDGSFRPPIRYPAAGSFAPSMAAADFDGDGIPDLAISNFTNVLNIGILLGKGDGTFKPAVNYPPQATGAPALANLKFAVGDFNGDGKADVIVAAPNSPGFGPGGNLIVMLGNGDGTLQPAVNYPFSAPALPYLAGVGDFDGDGKPDLLIGAGDSANLCVRLGKGDATFQEARCFANGIVTSVAVSDIDGDGKDDLVVGSQTPNMVSVLLANGDGTFSAAKPALASYANAITTADFNGDGKPDLAIVSQHGGAAGVGGITLLSGNGDGTFQTPVYYSPASYPSFVAVADFNGDGRADLITASNLGSNSPVGVWLGVFASLAASGGTPQSASPGQVFAAPLQATVRDAAGNPVKGATVTFTSPATGASAAFATTRAGIPQDVATDSSGAAAVYAVANDVAGSYAVTASAGSLSAAFALTNSLDAPGSFTIVPATVAPNTIAAAYGTFKGCTQAQVLVAGAATQVFYSSAGQINFLIPPAVANRSSVQVQILCGGQTSLPLPVPVVSAAPSLFTVTQNGLGQAAIVNQDGRVGPPSPAGTIVSVYGTGFGLLGPAGSDGLSRLVLPVTANVGGAPATVVYAGGAPQYTSGLQQINILIPAAVPNSPNATLVLTVGAASTQAASTQAGVTLAIQ